MPIYRPSDPTLWSEEPESLRHAQQLAEEAGMQVRHFVLGDPRVDTTPTTAVLRLPPGHVLKRHAHTCERFEVIVAGSLDINGEVYGPGTVMQTPAMEFYGPHIAGPEGCTTVEVFSSITGNGNVIYDNG